MRHEDYISRCLEVAVGSKCEKKRVGSVIVKDGKEIASGFNRPRYEDECERCLRMDIKGGTQIECCHGTHAEEVVILNALTEGWDLSDATLYVAALKLKDGKWIPKPSGKEYSCVTCAKTMAETTLESVVTLTKDGPRERSIMEAYYESFRHLEKIRSSLSKQ